MVNTIRTEKEEKWNAITHAVALGVVVATAAMCPTLPGKVLSMAYMLTFAMSVLYHSATSEDSKAFFRLLDMASIHVTIAATGASYCLMTGSPHWYLALVLPAFGFAFTVRMHPTTKPDKYMVPICLLSALVATALLMACDPSQQDTTWYVAGLAVYMMGLVFYMYEHSRWHHTVWHIMVTMAAFIHIRALW